MSNLIGKTILVTGATSGIGNAIANKLKQSGGNVIGVSRRKEDVNNFDGKCIVVELTNEEQIKEELAKIEKPDILINCAGLGIDEKEITETTSEEWDLMMDCNLKSMYVLTREHCIASISATLCRFFCYVLSTSTSFTTYFSR